MALVGKETIDDVEVNETDLNPEGNKFLKAQFFLWMIIQCRNLFTFNCLGLKPLAKGLDETLFL